MYTTPFCKSSHVLSKCSQLYNQKCCYYSVVNDCISNTINRTCIAYTDGKVSGIMLMCMASYTTYVHISLVFSYWVIFISCLGGSVILWCNLNDIIGDYFHLLVNTLGVCEYSHLFYTVTISSYSVQGGLNQWCNCAIVMVMVNIFDQITPCS